MKIRPLILILFLLGSIIFVGIIALIRNPRFPFIAFAYGPGIQDFEKRVTNGYVLYRNSAHEIFIAPNDGWNGEIAIIPSKVLKLNDYDEFIIAERQGLKRRSPNDSLDSYEIPDEKIKDYWILNTKKNYVLKQLNYEDFKRKLDSLEIPNDIKLIDVYNY